MNFPNKLTIVRMLIIPVIVILALFPYEQFGIEVLTFTWLSQEFSIVQIINLLLFIAGSITDFVDGNYARKHNMITTFGKFMDPIADKLLVNTMFLLFAVNGQVPAITFIIMLWRDTIVDGVRMLSSQKGVVVAAANIGKFKTVAQMIAIIVIMLNNLPFELVGIPMDQIVVWVATILSAISGLSYVYNAKDIILESK